MNIHIEFLNKCHMRAKKRKEDAEYEMRSITHEIVGLRSECKHEVFIHSIADESGFGASQGVMRRICASCGVERTNYEIPESEIK